MIFNEVIVLGAGAIGSVYGALLSKKIKVKLIGREKHVQIIKKNGLKISGNINAVFNLEADTEVRNISPKTLILLTTKAFDSVKAIKAIKPKLRADSVILILQNGFGQETAIKRLVKEAKVLNGLTYCAATFIKPGEIYFVKSGETILPNTVNGVTIARLFNAVGLKSKTVGEFMKKRWEKLLINSVVNPLTALFGVKSDCISSFQIDCLKRAILEEGLKVAEAEGFKLKGDYLEKVNAIVSGSDNKSSMLQDIEAGRKTEIDFLNGKIVELGRKHNIATPINKALVELIKAREI